MILTLLFLFSHGVYNGSDYLPPVYMDWIRQEERNPKERSNIVLLNERDRVLGFMSCFFLDKGRKIHQQSLRIDPRMQKSGIAKSFFRLYQDYMLENHPDLDEIIGCTGRFFT
jgi:hypothetical protein